MWRMRAKTRRMRWYLYNYIKQITAPVAPASDCPLNHQKAVWKKWARLKHFQCIGSIPQDKNFAWYNILAHASEDPPLSPSEQIFIHGPTCNICCCCCSPLPGDIAQSSTECKERGSSILVAMGSPLAPRSGHIGVALCLLSLAVLDGPDEIFRRLLTQMAVARKVSRSSHGAHVWWWTDRFLSRQHGQW